VKRIRGQEGSQVVLVVRSAAEGSAERRVSLVRTDLANANFRTAEVSGVLTGPDDQPLPREILIVVEKGTPEDGRHAGTICDGPTDAKGSFQFSLPTDRDWEVILVRDGREIARSAAFSTPNATASPEANYQLRLRWNGSTRIDAELQPVLPDRPAASIPEVKGTPLKVVIERSPVKADGSTQATIKRVPIPQEEIQENPR
jgi:hypothetical protein